MMARKENPFAAVGWLAVLIVLCAAIAFGGETDWNVFEANAVVASADAGAWQLFTRLSEPPPAADPPECVDWNVLAEPDAKSKLLSRFKSPCVLMFTAPHCIGPCNTAKNELKPMVEKSGWPVHQIDWADQSAAFETLGVESVPTFIAVRRNVECGRSEGADRKALIKMLTEANERDPK